MDCYEQQPLSVFFGGKLITLNALLLPYPIPNASFFFSSA